MRITVNLPSEFNEPSDLSDYGVVYLKDAVSAIKESLPKLISNASDSHWTISCVAGSDNSLSVEIFSADGKGYNIPKAYQFCNNNIISLFFVKIMSGELSDNRISLKLKVLQTHENCYYRSILDVARHAQDEIQFLLDHERFWSFRARDVIPHLTSESNLLDPRVLAKLSELVESNDPAYINAALSALRPALNYPQIKEIAKALIIKLAQSRKQSCSMETRLSALTALSTLLHEPDVQSLFEEIIQNYESHAVRTHALNLLEDLSDAEFNYRVELYQGMILELLPQSENDLATSLEFCIWNDQSASGKVFRSGAIDINRLVELFRKSAQSYPIGAHLTGRLGLNPSGGLTSSINQTAALYSILKFIAYTCDDIEIFNQVTTALIDITANHSLGLLDSIGELLDDVCKNPRIDPPQKVLELRKPRIPSRDVEGALGGGRQESEYSVFKKIRVKSLYDLIGNSELDANVRIVAIRDCQQYMFITYAWDKKEYEGYCNQLKPQLYHVARNTDENKDVRRAAYQIISWYCSVPENAAVHRIQFWYSNIKRRQREEEHADPVQFLAQNL